MTGKKTHSSLNGDDSLTGDIDILGQPEWGYEPSPLAVEENATSEAK
jgi:hypothetical protein